MNKKTYNRPAIKYVVTDDLMQDEVLHNSKGDGNQLGNNADFDDNEADNDVNSDIIRYSVWEE